MLLSKAQAIDELESTIPAFVERAFPGLYPPYLHVLRVDPDKMDAVRWAWMGADAAVVAAVCVCECLSLFGRRRGRGARTPGSE
jgi:hypothetical protein